MSLRSERKKRADELEKRGLQSLRSEALRRGLSLRHPVTKKFLDTRDLATLLAQLDLPNRPSGES